MSKLNQNSIDRITMYFKDGRRVEFTDMQEVAISSDFFDFNPSMKITIEMYNAECIEHTKRTSKRYKKNRKGMR